MQHTPRDILNYWFGDGTTAAEINAQKKDIWWQKNAAVDAEIARLFQDTTQQVAAGGLIDWRATPAGLLASIICLDQFSRNMHRDSARAFANDALALQLAQAMLQDEWDRDLPPIQRVFAYLPFEHSEDMQHQETSVQLFSGLLEIAAPDERDIFQGFLDFARSHYEVVQKFGRFPHRNALLARESSAEELQYLSQPGSGF